MMADQAVHTTT